MSVATLPYGFYLNLVGILVVLVIIQWRMRQSYLDSLTRASLLVVGGGMILSTLTAIDRGEAALQLANFLPFFWLFSLLPVVVRSPLYQVRLAQDIVLATVPINLVAIVEYAAKNNFLPMQLSSWNIVQSWQNAPHIGRAMVMFDHPNVLANYLTISLGLGLGLILSRLPSSFRGGVARSPTSSVSYPSNSPVPLWLWGVTLLNLMGIFCSGSRNGLLVALSQLLALTLLVKWNRFILLVVGLSTAVLGLGVSLFGLGQRSIGIAQVMDDPRVGVWKIAVDLIQSRPWLGWGPGSFKFLYPARLVDPEYRTVFHTHNLWLLLGAEYGLPIMLALTVTIGFICYRGARAVWQFTSVSPMASSDFQGSAQKQEKHHSDGHDGPQKDYEEDAITNRAIFAGYAMALAGSMGFSLLDVTLYDARLNLSNWVLLAVIYSWTLWPGSSPSQAVTHASVYKS